MHICDLQIRRLSEEDISKIDMVPNGLNIKSQANGIILNPEKKVDVPSRGHLINDSTDNEV